MCRISNYRSYTHPVISRHGSAQRRVGLLKKTNHNNMNQVTTEQAVATYKATTKNDPRESWANWILAIHNSLSCGDWIGGDNYPQWVESAFNVLNAEPTVSKADSN